MVSRGYGGADAGEGGGTGAGGPATEGSLTAPELILSLLDSSPQPRLSAAGLVAAGALLGVDAGAIRVAAARLVKRGVLAQAGRGVYVLGRRGAEVHRRVLAWHRVEEQTAPWDGRWIAVVTGHLGRSQKSALRGRQRALRLKGFAEARPGLAVRPANLRASPAALRRELIELGLDAEALLLGVDAGDPDLPFDPRTLWDTPALERRYAAHVRALDVSTARLPGLDTQSAARETLLLGRAVMRDILRDPLLPEALVNVRARRRLIAAMQAYDRLGKRCWRDFHRLLAAG